MAFHTSRSTRNATLFYLVLDMANFTISVRFYSTLTLVMALSCLWMVNKKPFYHSNQWSQVFKNLWTVICKCLCWTCCDSVFVEYYWRLDLCPWNRLYRINKGSNVTCLGFFLYFSLSFEITPIFEVNRNHEFHILSKHGLLTQSAKNISQVRHAKS